MRQKMTIMLLPVGLKCNLSCKYCYHGVMSKKLKELEVMSDSILERIICESSLFASDIDFLWHGGEPILAGIDHFKRAIEFQKQNALTDSKINGRIRNVIQSNLTLLTKELCDFFAENNFILSTSIDGYQEAHDANRVYFNGLGTYARVIESVSMWRNKGKSIGAVSLVTKASVEQPIKFFEQLKNSGITSCNFHFCAQDESRSIETIPEKESTARFFKTIFDLWMKDDNPDFPIRNFRNVLRTFCGGKPLDCHSNVEGCFGFIAVTVNGDVYPCHRYVGRENFCIGNVLETSLIDIYNNSNAVYREFFSLGQECRICEWLNVCGGGCALERFTAKGSFEVPDPDCLLKKELFEYIKNKAGYLFE